MDDPEDNGGSAQTTLTAAQNPDASSISTQSAPQPSTVGTQPQPTQNAPTPSKNDQTWGERVYHGVLNALGGSSDIALQRDPTTGKMIATQVKSGPGQQWKRIISGALTGYAAGAGIRGPGSAGAKIGAGIQAGQQQAEKRQGQQRQTADEDFDMQLKAATSQAQNALLNHQIAQSTFNLGRAQVDAAGQDTDRENTFAGLIAQGGAGSQDLGVFPDFKSVIDAFKANPELHDHQAGGRIVGIPHVNADGKIDGVHAALVSPDWLSSKINQDLPISQRTYEDGKLVESTFTIPAGSLTGDQYSKLIMAQSKDALEEYSAAQKENDTRKRDAAENTASYAAADKDKAEITALQSATSDQTIQSNAQQIYEGTMDPSNLNKMSRSGQAGATYNKTLAAVNALSLAQTGQPFDVAKAMGDYKFATQASTFNTLNYLNSLTGRDNKGGNLGTIIGMSDRLARTSFPPINNVEQWAKLAAGNPQVAAYRSAILEVSDQIAKILQGGGTGNATSDQKLRQAQGILSANFNAKQIRETATTLRELLGNRKSEIIGTNRYLQRWQGPQSAAAPPASSASAPTAAQLPPDALAMLKEGIVTKFASGQSWTLKNGQPVQVTQ